MKNKITVFSVSTAVLTVLTLGLFLCCLYLYYDMSVGYFDDCFPVFFFRALLAVDLLWCCTAFVLIPGDCVDSSPKKSASTFAADGIAAALFAVGGIGLIIENLHSSAVGLMGGICLLLGGLFFSASLLGAKKYIPFMGFFALLGVIMLLVIVYFNMRVAINGPFKNLLELTILACLFLILAELREHIGRPLRKATYVLRMAVSCLSSVTGIGSLVWLLTAAPDSAHKSLLSVFSLLPLIGLALRSFFLHLHAGEYSQIPDKEEENFSESEKQA